MTEMEASVVQVENPSIIHNADYIESTYEYSTVRVSTTRRPLSADGQLQAGACYSVTPFTEKLYFRTERKVPNVGVMLVGLGGNNGTTVLGGILANKKKLTWRTKKGTQAANWFGSVLMASTTRLGVDDVTGEDVYVPLNSLVPMLDPTKVVIGGWDINKTNLGDAMRRAQVLEPELQDKLYEDMKAVVPLPAVYVEDFIAANQKERADNLLVGSVQEQLDEVRGHIRHFRQSNKLDKVIVLWTATTERYSEVIPGVHDTAENIMAAVKKGHSEIAPSAVYCIASILEGCSYINGSPQNTLVPGIVELAQKHKVFLGGDDFKSGQTKLKSVLVDFLVSAGIKPTSIVSYNHLGNNDGKNLSSEAQFRSKEISKSTVVDDVVKSNNILYKEGEHPDHVVVIKYVPYVGDSKRALDEYTSEIFLGGQNTIVCHNTCEDSLLAAPLIIDLFVLTELCERIQMRDEGKDHWEKFHSVLSLLSYLCKAPAVPPNTPVVNALFPQRECLVNVLRALVGLPPENHMRLEHKRVTSGGQKAPSSATLPSTEVSN